MDIKEIAGKSFAGENIDELIKDFTSEQKLELEKATLGLVKDAKDKELSEVSALRKEKARLTTKTDEATKEIQDKIRGEQSVKARARLVKEFNLSPEDAAKVDDGFKTEALDSELIYEDYKRKYAYTFSDQLIKASQDKAVMEKNAAEFMAGQAGGGSGSGGGEGDKTYEPSVHEYVKEAAKRGISLTLEQAKVGLGYKPRIVS